MWYNKISTWKKNMVFIDFYEYLVTRLNDRNSMSELICSWTKVAKTGVILGCYFLGSLMNWTGHYSTNIDLWESKVNITGYRWTNLDLNVSLLDKTGHGWTDIDFFNSLVDQIHHWWPDLVHYYSASLKIAIAR